MHARTTGRTIQLASGRNAADRACRHSAIHHRLARQGQRRRDLRRIANDDRAGRAAIVGACARRGAAVYPQGGNTGLCYGAVPETARPGILISLKRMNRIRKVDRADNSLICDSGTVLTTVHAAAAEVGRQFPLHLGSEGTAQIGGLISTNAGGTGVLRYGAMRDLVLGLEVVLADGRIWNGLSTLRKDNTAYDLKHIFIGAEGTLGVVTGAALRLFPGMRTRADAWVALSSPLQRWNSTDFARTFSTRASRPSNCCPGLKSTSPSPRFPATACRSPPHPPGRY